jgi:hypothetical protein
MLDGSPMLKARSAWFLVGAVALTKCATSHGDTDGGGADATASDVPLVEDVSFGDVTTPDSPPPSCTPNAVYMLTWASNLYSFDPKTLVFTKIGKVSCLPSNFSSFSMAVDRQGTALIQGWVFGPPLVWYLKGVSTVDATCSGSVTIAGTPNFETAGGGMTFVADSPTSSTDTLYSAVLNGSAGSGSTFGLDTVNASTGSVAVVGGLNTDPSSGMTLTGTGDARMFAAESPVPSSDGGTTSIIFTQRDKSTGSATSSANVTIPAEYIVVGMVFWGGDFWFFLRPTGSAPAWMVGRYRTSDQSFTLMVNDIGAATNETGLGITAVAISTCAPLVPPN